MHVCVCARARVGVYVVCVIQTLTLMYLLFNSFVHFASMGIYQNCLSYIYIYITWSATHDVVSREINLWKSFDLLLGSNPWPLAPSAGCLTARPPELTFHELVWFGLVLLFGENPEAVAYSAQPLCWSGWETPSPPLTGEQYGKMEPKYAESGQARLCYVLREYLISLFIRHPRCCEARN